jgi:hypothetical protein
MKIRRADSNPSLHAARLEEAFGTPYRPGLSTMLDTDFFYEKAPFTSPGD